MRSQDKLLPQDSADLAAQVEADSVMGRLAAGAAADLAAVEDAGAAQREDRKESTRSGVRNA